MPANITDVDTFTATVQGIADGEPLNKAYLTDLAAQHLSNRARYLYNRNVSAKGGPVGIPLAALATPTAITFSASNGFWRNATTTQSQLVCPVPFHFNAALSSIEVRIAGASGLASLPGTLAQIRLIVFDVPTNTITTTYTQADTSVSLAAYKANHAITLTLGTARDFVETEAWYLVIDEDNGATAGFDIYGAKATIVAT